jgi:hypothetical protein
LSFGAVHQPQAGKLFLRFNAQFVRKGFRATVPAGVTWEQVLAPAYWTSVSDKIRAGDNIEVVPDNLAFYGRAIVTSAFGTRIEVQPLEHIVLDAVAPMDLAERSGFRVEDRGLTEKFCIVRLADGQTMATGIETAALAHQQVHSDLVPRASRRGFG